jgi:hypothetical protein
MRNPFRSGGIAVGILMDEFKRSVLKSKIRFNTLPILVIGALVMAMIMPSAGIADKPETVTICHATNSNSNPYNVQNPSRTADVGGHDGHNGPIWFDGIEVDWGDIIPPFDYDDGSYPGKNWTTDGQAIWNNSCNIPDAPPTTGTLTVIKETVGGNATFGFSGTSPIGEFSITTNNSTGNQVFSDLPANFYVITESPLPDGWAQTGNTCDDNDGGITVVAGQSVTCTITNTFTPPPSAVTIVAHKIVCDSESDLPNWGAEIGNPNIDANTAEDFLAQHPNCHAQSGWNFQWGPQTATEPEDSDTHIGSAGGLWQTMPATDGSGVSTVSLTSEDYGDSSYLWFREELQEGYIPFTYHTNGDTDADNVSAELYCHVDAYHYDNYDRIDDIQLGQTYNCVGFNVQIQQEEVTGGYVTGQKFNDLDGNGSWDEGELALGGWTIYADLNDNGVLDEGEPSDVTGNGDPDPLGRYTIHILSDGTFKIREVAQSGWSQTTPVDPDYYSISVSGGMTVDANYNFGNHENPIQQCTGSIDGKAFNDENGNGVLDLGEPGLSGWTLYLDKDGDNTLSEGDVSTTTDANGVYHFGGLLAGSYTLREVVLSGWHLVFPGANEDSEYLVTVSCDELQVSSFDLLIQAVASDGTNVNFANAINPSGGGGSTGGGGGGGGFPVPVTTPTEEVRGEQDTAPTSSPTSNEAVLGEQTLPVTGQPVAGLALVVLVILGFSGWRIKVTD